MAIETESRPRNDLSFSDPKRTVAVFAAVTAWTLAGVYYFLRSGFSDNSIVPVMEVLGLALFVLLLPAGFHLASNSFRSDPESTWLSSDSAISLLGLTLGVLAGLLRAAAGINLLPLFVFLGFALFVFVFSAWIRRGRPAANIFFLIGSILFSVWVAAAVYGSGYQNPLFEEAVTAGFYLCKDVLLTSAISNILKTYNFPSTGLDGLPYCFYHWGSYWIFAQMSNLLKMSSLKFSQLAYPIIFVPFLLSRILVFSIDVRERLVSRVPSRNLRGDWLFWILFVTVYIGFVPGEAAAKLALGSAISFISESYAVGLGLTFAVLSLTVNLVRSDDTRPRGLSIRDHALSLILPLLVVLIGFVKISLMYLVLIILGYLFLRLRLWKYKTPVFSLLVGLVALPVVTKLTTTSMGAGFDYIYPFAFFISNVSFAWKPFFFIFYYFWSWVFIGCKLYCEKVATVSDLKKAIRDRRIVDVEIVVVTCLAGAAPGFILPIGGGSASYFSDFQTWLSLGLLLANLDAFRDSLRARHAEAGKPGASIHGRFNVGGIKLTHLLAMFVGLCLFGSVLTNGARAVWRMAYLNLTIRCAVVDPAAGSSSWGFSEDEIYKRVVRLVKGRDVGGAKRLAGELAPFYTKAGMNLENAKNVKLMETLHKLAALPVSEKRQTAIFIPQSNEVYWNAYPLCEAVPLIVPAITGMAMIDGMPPDNCKIIYTNHYAVYQLRTGEQTQRADDSVGLCAYAHSKGFSKVIVVENDDSGNPKFDRVECP